MPSEPRHQPACHPGRRHYGRRLCKQCYDAAYRQGRTADFPSVTRRADDMLDDFALLRSEGYDRRQIAARLRIDVRTLDKALYRARLRGDGRARYVAAA